MSLMIHVKPLRKTTKGDKSPTDKVRPFRNTTKGDINPMGNVRPFNQVKKGTNCHCFNNPTITNENTMRIGD